MGFDNGKCKTNEKLLYMLEKTKKKRKKKVVFAN